MKNKIAPKYIHIAKTNCAEKDEIFDDFLENIEEFQQKFDVSGAEGLGRVKTQQRTKVVDIKHVNKNKNKLF